MRFRRLRGCCGTGSDSCGRGRNSRKHSDEQRRRNAVELDLPQEGTIQTQMGIPAGSAVHQIPIPPTKYRRRLREERAPPSKTYPVPILSTSSRSSLLGLKNGILLDRKSTRL